jgi:hypothetical protein
LPQIRKAVIYIDQFAVSNMLKVGNADTKGHDRTVEEPLWGELWSLLSRLRGLQLICCPDSGEHENESLLSPFFPALKKTYERLSGGVTFRDYEHIRLCQASELATSWTKGEPPKYNFDANEIAYGGVHDWKDRVYITVGSMKENLVDKIRAVRDTNHGELKRIFELWQREKKTFDEVYEEECSAYQQVVMAKYRRVIAARESIIRGEIAPDIDTMLHCEGELLIGTVQKAIARECAPDQVEILLMKFFADGLLKQLPINAISATLYAVMAQKAASGQKVPPNRGTFTDIGLISALLPYCDAIFIDNKSRALFSDIPKVRRLSFPCKIFSLSNRGEFLSYLGEIEASASVEHLEIVDTLYGRR